MLQHIAASSSIAAAGHYRDDCPSATNCQWLVGEGVAAATMMRLLHQPIGYFSAQPAAIILLTAVEQIFGSRVC